MEENAKQIAKALLLKMLKAILAAGMPVIIIVGIVIFGFYYITIQDGIWSENENSPNIYQNSATISGNGVEVDTEDIIVDALKNKGYTDAQIEQIRIELQNEGYSGEQLEEKFAERAIELLGIEGISDVSGISVAELIWNLNSEMYSKYLENYEQLEYLMNAELVTQMPYLSHLSSSDAINGRIYFDRYTIEGKKVRLVYLNESEFDKLVEESNSDSLNYFTMTENAQVKIAYWEEETGTITTNDSSIDVNKYDSRFTNASKSYTNTGYYSTNISYSSMIPQKYTLSFEYLWALLVISEDYEFVSGLAKLAYDSEIIISIYDSLLVNTNETEYTYTREQKDYSQITKEEINSTESISQSDVDLFENAGWTVAPKEHSSSSTKNVTNEAKGEIVQNSAVDYEVYKKIVITRNSISARLTYANVWVTEYTTEFNQVVEGSQTRPTGLQPQVSSAQTESAETYNTGSKKTEQELGEQTINSGYSGTWNSIYKDITVNKQKTRIYSQASVSIEETTKTSYIGETWSTTVTSPTNISEYTYTYSSNYINNTQKTNTREKTNIKGEINGNGQKIAENFCSLFFNSKKQDFILDHTGWLFEIMESNQNTADMIDLTKYLLNKATGTETFILDGFNFGSIFNTTSVGVLYGGSTEEQLWFALLDAGYSKISAAGVLGNIFAESGIISNNLQNTSNTSLGMSDEEYTDAVDSGIYANFVSDSAGYGLAQWTSAGRKEGLYLFAQSKGVSICDSSMQIEYLLGEISTGGGANGYASFQMACTRNGYNYSNWKNATTVEESAMAFCYVFERPAEADHSNRATYANTFYDKYKDATAPSSLVGSIELSTETRENMKLMLEEAIRIANDDRYGYSQARRYEEFYFDCSSLVQRLYTNYFGINMPSNTISYKNYEQYYVGEPTSITLQPGDVLWRGNNTEKGWSGHVIIYIGNGNYVAAHTDSKPKPQQITVYNDKPSKYMKVYRFIR